MHAAFMPRFKWIAFSAFVPCLLCDHWAEAATSELTTFSLDFDC
jgi:hypothetical protein